MFRPTPHIAAAVLALAAAAPAKAATVDHFTVAVSPRPVHAGDQVTLRAVARDASNAVVSSYAGAAKFDDSARALSPAETKSAGGVASATVTWTSPIHRDVVDVRTDDG